MAVQDSSATKKMSKVRGIIAGIVCLSILEAAVIYLLGVLYANKGASEAMAPFLAAIITVAIISVFFGLSISLRQNYLRRIAYTLIAIAVVCWLCGFVYMLVWHPGAHEPTSFSNDLSSETMPSKYQSDPLDRPG